MYADKKDIRSNVIKVRVNDAEFDALVSLARLGRKQRGTLGRELMLTELQRRIHEIQSKVKTTA